MILIVFERLAELVNADERLVHRGRFLTTTFLLESDADAWLIRVVEGRIERVERGPFLMRAWSFAIRAPAESWRRFWEPVPAPGYHDLFAMSRNGHARIEGNLVPLMTHLRYVRDVLSTPRRNQAAPRNPDGGVCMAAKIPGARVTVMKEAGHFPVSENPAQFRRYLLPVLDEVHSRNPPR